ncbi:MAG: glycosyltransferase family 4 protein [Candidatus Paceibacterota bacterium]|jgi:glycosyltransferase involved in cell wall biosynthesis
MAKQKLFIWCDSPTVSTGFGIVAKNLFRDLHNYYDVFILGINYFGTERYDVSKYFIYPVSEGEDTLGLTRFTKILRDVKPDKILLFQDIFNTQLVLPMIKKDFPRVPIMAYFPIDASTVNHYWRPGFDTPDKLVTYTQFAVDSIYECFPHLKAKNIEYLYHGVDTSVYRKLSGDVRKKFKEERGWQDKFVIFSNNRFQPRKNLGATVRALALFIKGYKVCSCGNVYLSTKHKCDLNGCGESEVLVEKLGHKDVFAYLHANIMETSMGPGPQNTLAAFILNAGFTNEDLPNHIGLFNRVSIYDDPYTDGEMNQLYNVADVNLSTSLGEGVGLSLIEAAATGTTSIAPNHTAIPEMLGDTGHIVPNIAFHTIARDNSSTRPIVDMVKLLEALETEYGRWSANGRRKVINERAIDRVNTLFLWDDKRQKLVNWLEKL